MAATVDYISARIKLLLEISTYRTVDLANITQAISENPSLEITALGTGANAANQIFADTRTLAASTSETLDCTGGLTNQYGQTCSFTKLRWIYVRNKATTSSVLKIGGATNAISTIFGDTSDKILLYPGYLALATNDATAYGLTAGTADSLKIENTDGSNSVIYDIILLGSE